MVRPTLVVCMILLALGPSVSALALPAPAPDLGASHPAAGPGGCPHEDLATFSFGTGTLLIDVPELQGRNHVDLAYPSCTGGAFLVIPVDGAVQAQNLCSERIARIYAPVGEVDLEFRVQWQTGSPPPGNCL